jgi:hypothetical protein
MSDELDTTEADMIAAMAEEASSDGGEEESFGKAQKSNSKSSKYGTDS